MTSRGASKAQEPFGKAKAFALALILGGAGLGLLPEYAARWRADAPSRLLGRDLRLDEAAREQIAEAAREVGENSGKRRDLAAAIRACEAALRASPWAPSVWLQKGGLLAEAGREEEALRCFEAARRIDPRNSRLRLVLGNELFFLRGAEAALPDHRAAAALDLKQGRLAWMEHLGAGADPAALAESLLPPGDAAARSAYFLDGIQRGSPGQAARLWDWLVREAPRRELWPEASAAYLKRLFERENRARAAAERVRVLGDCLGLGEEAPEGLRLDEGGLFNPSFRLPARQLGSGDWAFPPAKPPFRAEIAAEPSADAPAGRFEAPPGVEAPWLALRFSGFQNEFVAKPSQALLLEGPARWTLVFEAVSERLYTSNPLWLEMKVPSRSGATAWFRSPPLEGNRGPRTLELAFDVLDAEAPPQELRLRREPGEPGDPPLDGALYLRFAELRREPLDPGASAAPPEVAPERFRWAIDAKEPSLRLEKADQDF